VEITASRSWPAPPRDSLAAARQRWEDNFGESRPAAAGDSVFAIRHELNRLMTEKVGVFRTGAELQEAAGELAALRQRYRRLRVPGREAPFRYDLVEYLETGYLLELGEIIAGAALRRTESRGAHYRLDYPARDDRNWLKHTFIRRGEGGPVFTSGEVCITKHLPGERGY